jgi:hypothetical protein
MKKTYVLGIILIVVLIAAGCFWFLRVRPRSGSEGIAGNLIEKPKSFAHLPLTGTRRSGSILIGQLESPMVIDGYPCDASWVHFSESGKLKAFLLSDTCMIQGNRIPKGTWMRLYPDQTLQSCSFPEDSDIQGYLCDGGFGGSEGVTTGFYPSGRLEAFYSPKDIVVQGFPCKASAFSPIYLHENGKLKKATLARDLVTGGVSLSSWQTVVLDDRGAILSVSGPARLLQARDWIAGLFR